MGLNATVFKSDSITVAKRHELVGMERCFLVDSEHVGKSEIDSRPAFHESSPQSFWTLVGDKHSVLKRRMCIDNMKYRFLVKPQKVHGQFVIIHDCFVRNTCPETKGARREFLTLGACGRHFFDYLTQVGSRLTYVRSFEKIKQLLR